MNPPQELRALCEPLMQAASQKDFSPSTVAGLGQLCDYLGRSDVTVSPFIEFVMLPMFFILSSDPADLPLVPERVLEGVLMCFEALIRKCSDHVAMRSDLFVPLFMRAISVLTDAGPEGRLKASLKEETKKAACVVITSLVVTQPINQVQFLQENALMHCVALLLELISVERSKDLKCDALRGLKEILTRLKVTQIEFVFPGAASTLTEMSRGNVKKGSQVRELSLNCLRILVSKGLRSPTQQRNLLTNSNDIAAKMHDLQKQAEELRIGKSQASQDALVIDGDANSKESQTQGERLMSARKRKSTEEPTFSTMARLFPLLKLIWQNDAEDDTVQSEVRLAQLQVVVALICDCPSALAEESEYVDFFLRQLALACGDSSPLVRKLAIDTLQLLLTSSSHIPSTILGSKSRFEKILISSLVSLKDIAPQEDEAVLRARLDMCAQLLSFFAESFELGMQISSASFREVVWSLLLCMDVQGDRFEQHGKVEFARLTSTWAKQSAFDLFNTMRNLCPAFARSIHEVLYDSLKAFFASRSKSVQFEGDYDEDASSGVMLKLTRSTLPSAIVLMRTFCDQSDKSTGQLVKRLIELDHIWGLPALPSLAARVSLQEAQSNALAIGCALEGLTYCATRLGRGFRFHLVDALFCVLQCIGNSNRGIKLCAAATLTQIASACEYSLESQMLQENLDYVVDALIRRVPQMTNRDILFANVIEALVDRIPVWTAERETSPWVRDLVNAVLEGLNDRFASPEAAWSLLRIGEAIVARGTKFYSATTMDRSNGPLEYLAREDPLSDGSSDAVVRANELPTRGIKLNLETILALSKDKSNADHQRAFDEALNELSEFYQEINTDQHPQRKVEELDSDEDESEKKDSAILAPQALDRNHILDALEALLEKAALFLSEEDVLVRQQAAVVACNGIITLAQMDPERTRQAVLRVWPAMVDQIKHERNPVILGLILDVLICAVRIPEGEDFFGSKFFDDVWPAMEGVIERAIPSSKRKAKIIESRDIDLVKRILGTLPALNNLLRPRAERIAKVTAKFLSLPDVYWRDIKDLTCQVWLVLATVAGDAIWLPVAVACGHVSLDQHRQLDFELVDKRLAEDIWQILQI